MGSTRSSHTPPTAPPPMHNLAHDEHIPSGGTFVRTDEPTLIHHYHPNTAVSTGFILGFVPFMGLDKYIVTCIHHYCIIQSRFTAPSIHLFIPPLHFNSWQPLCFYYIYIVLSFPECHTVGITQYVAFSDWLTSLSNMHLVFSSVFSWLNISLRLIAHFVLALNTSPLSGCTMVYLSIH